MIKTLKCLILPLLLLISFTIYSSPTPIPPEKTYRKDSRPPSVIFREGFFPRGHNINLLSHLRGISVWAQSGIQASGFISTTADINVARNFQPDIDGFVYEIVPPSSSYDALLSLQHGIEQLPEGSEDRTSWQETLEFTQRLNQQQWVTTDRIRPGRIVGAYPIIQNPESPLEPLLGELISNPNFDQYATPSASPTFYPVNSELPSYFAYVRSEMRNSLRSLAFSCLGVRGSNNRSNSDDTCREPELDINYINKYSLGIDFNLVKVIDTSNFDFGKSNKTWNDFNGDGLMDYCSISGKQIVCMIQNENNSFERLTQHVGDVGWSDSRYWIDFNGDGITDYCRITDTWTRLQCNEGTESGYFKNVIISDYIDAGWVSTRRWASIDGDGTKSFCRQVQQYGSEMAIRCINPTKSFHDTYMRDFTSGRARYDYGYAKSQIWGDIDGDRKDDFCFITGSSRYELNCLLTVGKDFSQSQIFHANLDQWPDTFAIIDINNDLKSDYCFTVGGKMSCRLNENLTLLSPSPLIGNKLNASLGTWGDINNDGFIDLCHRPNDNTISCFINGGTTPHLSVNQSFSELNNASSGQFYYPIIGTNAYCSKNGSINTCYSLNTPRVDSYCEVLIYQDNTWVWRPDSQFLDKVSCENNNYCSEPGGTCRQWQYFR